MGGTVAASEKQTLADAAYTQLKARIIQGELAPGAKVSIDGLARGLEFSQTPIREALARLESEGLLARRPLSGYTVTPLLTAAELADLYEIRLLLEPLAARRAAERDPHTGAPGAAEALTAAARMPEPNGTEQFGRLCFTEADARFHAEVARLSGSAQLANAIRRLDAHMHLYRAYIGPKAIEETEAEHRAIAEAVARLQPNAAAEAMRHHLKRARNRHNEAFRNAEAAQAGHTTHQGPGDRDPKRGERTP